MEGIVIGDGHDRQHTARPKAGLSRIAQARKGATVTSTLASGTTISIPASDIDAPMSALLVQAVEHETEIQALRARLFNNSNVPRPPNPAPASSAPVEPSPSGQGATIRAKCQSEWRDDFRMQAYCESKQRTALIALQQRSMSGGNLAIIRTKCASEWVDDFAMRNYCEEKQLEALTTLGR